MAVDLIVPEVGESISEVVIGRWLIEEGQEVKKDDPVVEIESDKVTLELPAPVSGVVSTHGKAHGDEAKVGDVIGQMEEGASAGKSDNNADKATTKQQEPASQTKQDSSNQESEQKAQEQVAASDNQKQTKIMPAAQRMLDENNLKASEIKATGPRGRLLKEDVERYLKQGAKEDSKGQSVPSAAPFSSSAKAEPENEEVVPMSPMRKRIAHRLVDAQKNAALLTTFNEVDMSAVMDFRKQYKQEFIDKYSVKLGFMSFFVKASIDALKQYPAVNAEIQGENIIYKNHYDIGIAVGTGKGLVVPILRDAQTMSFADIEKSISDFATRIKENKLKIDELSGGSFTITNGGVFGSLLSTPIVNPPQSAVLGMHTIQQRPVAINGEVKIRPMMYLALTYDHRIVDGREAVSFLKRIKDAIESPSRMLMEV